MLVVGDRLTSSAMATLVIGLVSPAVLTAIITSAHLLDQRAIVQPDPAAGLSVAGAVQAVRRTSNVAMALAVDLPIYWLSLRRWRPPASVGGNLAAPAHGPAHRASLDPRTPHEWRRARPGRRDRIRLTTQGQLSACCVGAVPSIR